MSFSTQNLQNMARGLFRSSIVRNRGGDSIAWGQEKLSRGDSSLKIWTRMSFGADMSAVGAEIIQRKCMRIASLQPVFQGRHAQVRSHSFKNERRRIVAMPWRLLR
jgi:uncharacterized membrane protein YoaK (UPF0700 family)